MRGGGRARWAALLLAALCACRHAPAGQGSLRTKLLEDDARHAEPQPVGVYHVVKPGETLYRIARAYGLAPEELAEDNGIADPRDLPSGFRLFIPGAAREVPLPAAGLDGASLSGAAPGGRERRGHPTLAWPLRGVIYARFGAHGGERHDGVDLAAPEGTPIAAAADGKVLYAGTQRGYGTLVILQHDDGLITLYAHNREDLVREGQQVAQGQIIARVGRSGRTTGPHLHFEVRRGTSPVDPLPLLPSPGG